MKLAGICVEENYFAIEGESTLLAAAKVLPLPVHQRNIHTKNGNGVNLAGFEAEILQEICG